MEKYVNIYHKSERRRIEINITELILISIPEMLVIYLLSNMLLGNALLKKDIFKLSILASISCYFIRNTVTQGISVIFLFLTCVLLFWHYSKISFIYCFISISIGFGLKFVSEFIVLLLINLAGVSINDLLSNQGLKILVSYVPVTINLLMYLDNYKKNINLLVKKDKKNNGLNNYISKHIVYLLIFLSIVNLFIISYMIKIIYNGDKIYNDSELIVVFMIISTLLCVICLIIAILFLNKFKKIFQIENNLMRKNLNQMNETIDLLRIQKHDYMNHLQVILMQITSGKVEDARKYILGMAECSKNSSLVFNTGNNYIDAILNLKNTKCIEHNINLTACVDSLLENTNLEDVQLSSILLNIIDNAIDELSKNNKSYKYIHLDTYKENNEHNISIKNNGRMIEDIQNIFKIGFSSKGNNRGYGLYYIKKLLENNNCSIEVYSDEYETEFNIKIPIK